MEWIKKYEPKTIDELVGNTEVIASIHQWLQDFYKADQTQHSIILSGPHGSGKTLISKLLLHETGYTLVFLDSNKSKTQEVFDNFKKRVQNKGSVHNLMTCRTGKKYALVIDNSENITLNSEKNSILNFHKENEKRKMHPIIIITTSQHSKMISDIKKKHKNEHYLELPTTQDLTIIVDRIGKQECITFENAKVVHAIIEFSQHDIRRLINLLYDMHITFHKKNITLHDFESFSYASKLKNVDIGLFDATRDCMDKYCTIQDTLKMYEMEKVLLPLMIYENYKNKLFSQNFSKDIHLEKSRIISEYISHGDIIETNIYTDQNWYLQNIHGFYTCCVPAFYINAETCNESQAGSVANELQAGSCGELNIDSRTNPIFSVRKKSTYSVIFSSDLNKTSSKNINKKNFNILKGSVIDKSSKDIMYLNKIFYHLAQLEDYPKIAKLMIVHNITIKNFEILVKIDKTVAEKINFTAKTKRVLQKELNHQLEELSCSH